MGANLIHIIFYVLGKGFAGCNKYDKRVSSEVAEWVEGTTVLLGVAFNGPSLLLKKQDGKIIMLKPETIKSPDVAIYFKSIQGALLVVTGRIGIWQAYAEHRFTLKGDIFFSMSVVRCMDSIENYLFPPFITNKILRRRPTKSVSSLKIYRTILFGVR